MKRGVAILALLAAAACSQGGGGIDPATRAQYDVAVLNAAPNEVPVYTEMALNGCRMAGDVPLCGSCTVTVATAQHAHRVGATLEEHEVGRTDDAGAPAVSVTSELDYADFPHNGTRGGIEAAISDAHAWCEAFHPEQVVTLRDVRDAEISTGDEE
ncbi:hypothetical protein [Maricaulis sp.]|uniref:hypothetical protein n=1 Tax=Maricaulis sp. TaxID=1486257 RepID=UPI00261545F8|nr:hypothetical protein [Maricaulis sp.]